VLTAKYPGGAQMRARMWPCSSFTRWCPERVSSKRKRESGDSLISPMRATSIIAVWLVAVPRRWPGASMMFAAEGDPLPSTALQLPSAVQLNRYWKPAPINSNAMLAASAQGRLRRRRDGAAIRGADRSRARTP
jgi:hypothetical protein